jgi:hypothetical protein
MKTGALEEASRRSRRLCDERQAGMRINLEEVGYSVLEDKAGHSQNPA